MALSETTVKLIKDAQQHMPIPRAALLFALRTVQAERGQVGSMEVEILSELFAVSPVQIEGVARFYDLLSCGRTGRHEVRLCEGVVCVMRAGDAVWEAIRDAAATDGIAKESVSIERAACLGHCDHAPAALVDGLLIGPLDRDNVHEILASAVGSEVRDD